MGIDPYGETGRDFPVFKCALVLFFGLPLLAWLIGGAPATMSVPKLAGFNFKGGLTISPEFTALLLGLVLYTAAFVAEVVRAGIQSVGKGQREAAVSIGLTQSQVLNLVILPQALRVIVPPLTSQMLNLTKKLLACCGHRIPGLCFRSRYHHQPDRPGDRRSGVDHDRLPDFQPLHIGLYELVQQKNCPGGEIR